MAEKRMFAKSIVESDAFLDMPASSQALYLHLNMNADDEGFVNNPKKILRICGCAADDLNLLILKKFIIRFDSGIVVIKHWKINNYLQKDRTKSSVYEYEKSLLFLKPNKAYTLDDSKGKPLCIQNVSNMYPQYSIGEVSIDEISIDKIRIEDKEVLKKYLSSIPEKRMSPATANTLLSLIKNFGRDFVTEAINVAVIRDKPQLDYIIGILNSWKCKKFKTIADIENERKQSDNENIQEMEYQKCGPKMDELDSLYDN